jgi:hypothetical protein
MMRSVRVLSSISVILTVAALAMAPLASQDHRESPADRAKTPAATVDRNLQDPALVGAIDLHVHSDPDSYRRSVDPFEAAINAKSRGMRAIVLKNHFSQTAGLAYLVRKQVPGIEVFGGIALNTPVGGINPEAVRHMTEIRGGYGRIVWMPTHDSEQEVTTLKEKRPFVAVSANGKLLPKVHEVLDLIAQRDLVLATGHVSAKELVLLLQAAKAHKITRIIVTHPTLGEQFTFLTIPQMKAAAQQGAYIEFVSYFAFEPGTDADVKKTADIIHAIGPASVIISSDVGLAGRPLHPDALALAAQALRKQGFTEADLNRMFKENPARLLGLK